MKSHNGRIGCRAIAMALAIFCLLLQTGCDRPIAKEHDKEFAPVTKQGGKLTIMVSWPHVGAVEKLVQLFNDETGTVVHIIKTELHDILGLTIKDFNSPTPQADIYLFWYGNLGRLAEKAVIVPLDMFYKKYAETLDTADLIPHFFDQYTLYRNQRWAVPFDGDMHVLFYKKSLFAKHNLTPPKTWGEYLRIARYITEQERDNNIFGAAFMAYPTPFLITGSFLNRLGGFGGTLVDQNQEPRINTPEAVAALEAMVAHARYALPSPLETDFAVARDAFIQGKVGMVEQWTDIGIMAEDPKQSMICGDWGVVPIPMAEGVEGKGVAPLNGGWSMGISANSSKRDVAERFLSFAIRRDITLQLNLIPGGGGLDPIRKSTIASPEFHAFAPQVSQVEAQLIEGNLVAIPSHPAIPDLIESLTDAIVAALENRLSPSEALRACQETWNQQLTGGQFRTDLGSLQ